MEGKYRQRLRLSRRTAVATCAMSLVAALAVLPNTATAEPTQATNCVTPGTVCAWGNGDLGQLGTGTTAVTNPIPTQLPGLTDVTEIAATLYRGAALKADGTVWKWGGGGGPNDMIPAQIQGYSNVTKIAYGGGTIQGLRSDGTVWMWGNGVFGQLGNGQDGEGYASLVPVQVTGLTQVIDIAMGGNTAYALRVDGTVWAWGRGRNGQLGNGTRGSGFFENSTTAVQVQNLTSIAVIAGGAQNGYAVTTSGVVWAWGESDYNQLGIVSSEDALTPVQIPDLTGVVAVFSNFLTAYALKSDGSVWVWGSGAGNEFADGTGGLGRYSTPIQISGLSDVVSIAAGARVAYALRSDGTLWAWGVNEYGGFGFLAPDGQVAPAGVFQVPGITSPKALAAGAAAGFIIVGGEAPRGSRYVALGDSYSSGEGNPPWGESSGAQICHRSPEGWPSLLAEQAQEITLMANLACSGAKTDALTGGFKEQPSQIDTMALLNPEIVTVTIGGNDIGFSSTIIRCVIDNCSSQVLQTYRKIIEFGQEASSYYEQIKAATPQGARVVVVGYPRIFPMRQSDTIGCGWLTPRERNLLNGAAVLLNRVLAEAARRAQVEYVSTLEVLNGHEMCTHDSWMHPALAFDEASGHPTRSGQEAIAISVRTHLGPLNS